MPTPYTQQKIENWVSDFTLSDALQPFSPPTREIAGTVLLAFLTAACEHRNIEPEDLEEPDIKSALLHIARLNIPEPAQPEIPELCAALLTQLQTEGRLGGGKLLGAFAKALTPTYLEQASGKQKPITRPNTKISRNDPCPCGSGKKYKKCCLND